MTANFVLKPIEAHLVHDTDFLTKMNPYCVFVIEGKRINSQVCKRGGKHPHWNDAVTIPANSEYKILVKLMDKDRFTSDDHIGSFIMDLQETVSQGKTSKWYTLLHKNKPAGEILIESTFQGDHPFMEERVEPSNLFKKESLLDGPNKPILVSQEGGEQRQHIESHVFAKNVDGVVINPIVTKSLYVKKPEELTDLGLLTEIATKTVGSATPTGMKRKDSLREFKNAKIFDNGNKDIVDEKIKEMCIDFDKLEHLDCEFKRY